MLGLGAVAGLAYLIYYASTRPPPPQTTPQGYRVIEAGEVPAGTGQVQPSPGTHFCRRGHTAQIIEIPQSLPCSTVENMD